MFIYTHIDIHIGGNNSDCLRTPRALFPSGYFFLNASLRHLIYVSVQFSLIQIVSKQINLIEQQSFATCEVSLDCDTYGD